MSAYSYTLIVKGSELEAGCATKERLGGLAGVSIEGRIPWSEHERCYIATASQDLTEVLNKWFTEDFAGSAPFPLGSLLFWNKL